VVVDAATDAASPTPPTIDRDSNAACSLDRVQQEDLVFAEPPGPGSYLIFANLFDACQRAPVHFRLSVWVRQLGPDGKLTLTENESKSGTLTAVDANGGSKVGTYVTEVAF
jgi:hypothetical protein